jgi:hypothetical protein
VDALDAAARIVEQMPMTRTALRLLCAAALAAAPLLPRPAAAQQNEGKSVLHVPDAADAPAAKPAEPPLIGNAPLPRPNRPPKVANPPRPPPSPGTKRIEGVGF